MKKRLISVFLALVFIFGAATLTSAAPGAAEASRKPVSAASSGIDSARETVAKAAAVFAAAEPIREWLIKQVSSELDDWGEDDDSEFDFNEANTALIEADGHSYQLRALLTDLSALPDSPDTSEGKTVLAAREYLTLLLNMTTDFFELVKYAIDFVNALTLLNGMYVETDNYTTYAYYIRTASQAAINALENMSVPAYMAVAQGKIVSILAELVSYADDLTNAAKLNDPLRTYSCLYRFDRIIQLFDIGAGYLDDDLYLQMQQAKRRLDGPIGQLHDELERNLALLTSV